MDELEISGKRFISSKRIARENRYHPDYVGQLIRGGKVVGTKVGRAWYVDEQSFAEYLGKESVPPVSEISIAPEPTPTSIPVVEEEPVAVVEIEKTEEPAPAPIGAPKPVQPPVPVRKPTLTYIADNRPLFPEIAKRVSAVDKPRIAAPAMPIAAQPASAVAAPVVTIAPKAPRNIKTGLAVMSFSALGALILSVAFFGSLDINSLISVQKNKPASISYVQAQTLCFIFKTCQNKQ